MEPFRSQFIKNLAQKLYFSQFPNHMKGMAPLPIKVPYQDGVTLKELGKLGWGATKAHPFKALYYGSNAFANLGGLTDNDKIGGQLGGALIGGLLGYKLGRGVPGAALLGGALGAQFDKLRAAREAQAQQAQYRLGR